MCSGRLEVDRSDLVDLGAKEELQSTNRPFHSRTEIDLEGTVFEEAYAGVRVLEVLPTYLSHHHCVGARGCT